ncbi:alpha/beta hydrolase [Nocardia vinacea]|nr:alpha/beta hydrolase [Nocardia vinacea]
MCCGFGEKRQTASAESSQLPAGRLAGWAKVESLDLQRRDHRGHGWSRSVTEWLSLPPTFTYVGELEPFLDETVAYVDGLRTCGVPVDFEVYPGCWHGFDRLVPPAEVSRRALGSRERWFRHAAATYVAPQPAMDLVGRPPRPVLRV